MSSVFLLLLPFAYVAFAYVAYAVLLAVAVDVVSECWCCLYSCYLNCKSVDTLVISSSVPSQRLLLLFQRLSL